MYLSLETSCEFCTSALWEKIRCDARWTSRRCVPRKQTKALGGSQARIYNISPGTINYTWSMSCVSVTTNLYLGVGMICLRETGISGVEMTHSVSCERWFFLSSSNSSSHTLTSPCPRCSPNLIKFTVPTHVSSLLRLAYPPFRRLAYYHPWNTPGAS